MKTFLFLLSTLVAFAGNARSCKPFLLEVGAKPNVQTLKKSTVYQVAIEKVCEDPSDDSTSSAKLIFRSIILTDKGSPWIDLSLNVPSTEEPGDIPEAILASKMLSMAADGVPASVFAHFSETTIPQLEEAMRAHAANDDTKMKSILNSSKAELRAFLIESK